MNTLKENEGKQESNFNQKTMKKITYLLFNIIILSACNLKTSVIESDSTIDSTTQTEITTILESKLSELNALYGQAIIMEVQIKLF